MEILSSSVGNKGGFKETKAKSLVSKSNFATPPHQIQKVVCAHFRLSLTELKSPSREKSVVRARNIAIYLMRENLKLTLSDIGGFFGGRNHSTLLNSLKNIKKDLKENQKLQQTLTKLNQSF